MEVIKPMDFSSFSAFCEHLDKSTKKAANTTTTTAAAATATVTATTTPLIQATTANGVAGASSALALAVTPPPIPNLVNGNANNYHQYIEVLNDYDCCQIHTYKCNNFGCVASK